MQRTLAVRCKQKRKENASQVNRIRKSSCRNLRTLSRLTIDATKQSKRNRIEIILSYLGAWEMQPGIYSCSIHPLKNEITPDRIGYKGCPREYTHIHMGVHQDILKRKGEKRSVTRPTSKVSPFQTGCSLSKWKTKNGLQEILTETTTKEKLNKRQVIIVNLF
jgi:hypothetical protein